MTKNKALKNKKVSTMLSLIKPKNERLDTKVMTMMLSGIINQIQSTNLYSEDQGVVEDYEQMIYAIKTLHTYLYDQSQSNLTIQDAKILAAYLVEKTKSLKSVIDKLHQK